MPTRRGTDRKGGFYRYGKSGKKYRYKSESGRKKAKAKASIQGRAIKSKSKDAKKTPAKPSERKKGSKRNKPGSAAGKSGKITLSEKTTETLKKKVKEHNAKGGKVTLGQLKAVYRRGAGAFSTSHHPNANRHSWSMGRVNSFLRRGHSQDDDLR
tara:strand:- start:228 stop:692 length:465 start_codon:yes stop_codon:yes gene_type:complete